jgi:hypothetical protein
MGDATYSSAPVNPLNADIRSFSLYRAFTAELEEILKHKWIESEKAGRDVGFDWALINWTTHHRRSWRKAYLERQLAESSRLAAA